MQVLNSGFNSTPFKFALKGVSRNVTRLPTDNRVDTAAFFRGKFRKGDYRTLNLYYSPEKANYGVCTFPSMAAAVDRNTFEFLLDGCTMGSNTTPGSSGSLHAGKTTIHEVGHWLGLLHTFRGGCSSPTGDYVADTPVEADFSSAANITDICPIGRDSCPELPGLDPIHNYMDYSSE